MRSNASAQIVQALRAAFPPKAAIVLAVSGGKDSMALLHGACELATKMKWRLVVGHVDHQLRKNSAADARFVRKECRRLAVRCVTHRLSKKPVKQNTEAWAREKRYQFLEMLRRSSRSKIIATAHHANDVAETFLIKILQHKELTALKERDIDRHLVRPFWAIPSKVIQDYVAAADINYREDESNRDPKFLRNRVRGEVLPLLSNLCGVDAAAILAAEAGEVSEDLAALDELAAPAVARLHKISFGSKKWLQVLREELKLWPQPVGWRMVRAALVPQLGYHLGRAAATRVIQFICGNGAQLELPGGVTLRRLKGGLQI